MFTINSSLSAEKFTAQPEVHRDRIPVVFRPLKIPEMGIVWQLVFVFLVLKADETRSCSSGKNNYFPNPIAKSRGPIRTFHKPTKVVVFQEILTQSLSEF